MKTVEQLIKELQEFPKETKVYTYTDELGVNLIDAEIQSTNHSIAYKFLETTPDYGEIFIII